MKTKENLAKSAAAALQQARRCAAQVERLAISLDSATPEYVSSTMPTLRAQLAELNQRVHEFNAYHNALHTD